MAGLTSFRHEDALGSLRFLTNSSQSVTGSGLFEAFGAGVGATGYNVAFGWVGGADCQTEADTGLVLMGHRYYDSRVGRFISQDHAHSGNNWYRYAGNDPVNNTDPSGLSAINMFSAPDGRNQGPLGGNSGALMDFFANIDYWASQGQGDSTQYGAGKKSGPKPEPVFNKKDDAGIAAAKAAYLKNPIDHENFGFIISIIINKTLSYTFTPPVETALIDGSDPNQPLPTPPTDAVGWYHSHPSGLHEGDPNMFSDGDNQVTNFYNVTGYLGAPFVILKAEPSSKPNQDPVITNLKTGW